MEQKITIGILEDDEAHANLISAWLADEGYETFAAATADEFIEKFLVDSPDLVLLDWMLPGRDGIEVLGELRDHYQYKGPVIFVTNRESEEDIIRALRAGADDYIVKPPSQGILLARVEALVRRYGVGQEANQLKVGPIEIDMQTQQVLVNGELIKLTPKDYKLACVILSNVGKLLTREFLLKNVWGIEGKVDTRTVDVHISRLRRSLGIQPSMGYYIKTIYQLGYRLEKVKTVEGTAKAKDD